MCFVLSVCVLHCVCSCICAVCCVCVFVWGFGSRSERALSVSSVASRSGVAGCGLVCAGWRRTDSGKEMILIKEIVGCLNLIRLPVPLTDVIALIGSFVSFTHSVDVTMEMFSACLIVRYPASVCVWGEFCQPPCLYYIMSVCLCLSPCLSFRLAKIRVELQNDSLLKRYKSCCRLQPPRKYTLLPGIVSNGIFFSGCILKV